MKCDRCKQNAQRLKLAKTKELLCDSCRTTPPLPPSDYVQAIERYVRDGTSR